MTKRNQQMGHNRMNIFGWEIGKQVTQSERNLVGNPATGRTKTNMIIAKPENRLDKHNPKAKGIENTIQNKA